MSFLVSQAHFNSQPSYSLAKMDDRKLNHLGAIETHAEFMYLVKKAWRVKRHHLNGESVQSISRHTSLAKFFKQTHFIAQTRHA